MKTPVVFLLLLGVALARGDASPDKVNQLETKNIHQVIKPAAGLEAASTRTGDPQMTRMQFQTNRMDNQELNYQQHSQLQNSQSRVQTEEATQFYGQNPAAAPPMDHGQDPAAAQQFHRQNSQAPFQNQGQAQFRQFHQRQSQTVPGSRSEQEISSLLQSQQRMTPATSTVQSHEQRSDYAAAQQMYSDPRQQEFYQDGGSVADQQDEGRRFADSSDRPSPVVGGFQSSEMMRTGAGFPQVFHPQRSAFDNRAHPIVLPGVSQTHSTSVVVSGLKNLPVLPALVYSAGAVPQPHAIGYGRPMFQGAAYVKQHWQTPYARYVYSHIL